MKKLTVFIFTLLTYSFVVAQTFPVTISGTVNNFGGGPAEGVNIFITTDSINIDFEYFDQTSTAADGTYSFTLDVPNANSQGGAIVYMEDCANNFEFENVSWYPTNTDLTVDFTYCPPPCDVTINGESNPTGTVITLTGSSIGAAPYTYEWNTGDVTASINVEVSNWYCVTVTDNNGCSSSNCFYAEVDNGGGQDSLCWAFVYTFVVEDSIGSEGYYAGVDASGVAPFTYLWSTGSTNEVIPITVGGEYCVTITDATGCEATSCVDSEIEDCSTGIFCSLDGELSASAIGVAPFTYTWSTGETTAAIYPTASGDYCVTVTDAEGCVSEACTYHFEDGGQDTSCWVTIAEVQNGAWIQAIPQGTAPFAYIWDNGATEGAIELEGSGTYCVTVTDANNCASTACYQHTSNVPDNYRISGFVYPLDSINIIFTEVTGLVYLIVHDEDEGTLTAIDTVEMQDGGYYDFGEVPAGNYLVKAAYDEGIDIYEDNLPTYFGGVLWWNEATNITIPYTSSNVFGRNFHVYMVPGENPGGPGFIGGLISEGANFAGDVVDTRSGDPLAGISVLLLTDANEAVTHTVSDENGEFSFPDLAWGTYKVYIEIEGIEQVFHRVTIGPDNPEVNNIAFEVGEEGIVNSLKDFLKGKAFEVYPNPATDQVFVSVNSTEEFEGRLQVTDITGQTMLSQTKTFYQGEQQINLNINSLPTGIYFLNIQTGKKLVSRKIVKK